MNGIIGLALKEDIGPGDITTRSVVPRSAYALAHLTAKEGGIVYGLEVARRVFKAVDRRISFKLTRKDGSVVSKGRVLAKITGPAGSIITAERTALNFLQRLSGVATTSGAYAAAVKGTGAKVLDTRKTTPGMRQMERAAVKAGGCLNHRMGLFDRILIKDNHLRIDSITSAVKRAKKKGFVEVEAETLSQVLEAAAAGADRILLDNMSLPLMKKSVTLIKSSNRRNGTKIRTEASGGVNLRNIRRIAMTGVDFISVGALTHSSRALDFSLDIIRVYRK